MFDHVGYNVSDFTRSRVCYVAALAPLGATVLGEGPGPRPNYGPTYYAAFVLDPDGHNVEAVTHNAD